MSASLSEAFACSVADGAMMLILFRSDWVACCMD